MLNLKRSTRSRSVETSLGPIAKQTTYMNYAQRQTILLTKLNSMALVRERTIPILLTTALNTAVKLIQNGGVVAASLSSFGASCSSTPLFKCS
jgi:hypothetical protein